MATKERKPLTAAQVNGKLKAGVYPDVDGLFLRVAESGKRNWVQRFMVNGKQVSMGLGSAPAVGLADARQLAARNRKAVQEGHDPRDTQRQAKQETEARSLIPTFSEVTQIVYALRRPNWKSQRHADQWLECLRIHAFPNLSEKRVDTITSGDILDVLEPIWNGKAETARRVKQRASTIFDYAVAHDWMEANPVNVKVQGALPKNKAGKSHHPSLPYTEAPAALSAIRGSSSRLVTRMAYEFLILTATRVGETVGATWDEIDLDTRTWTIAGQRMKNELPHRVPLSDRAVEILLVARELYGNSGLVFPSNRKQGALSNESFRMMTARLDISCVPHGWRTTFNEWLSDTTNTPLTVIRAALAHHVGNEVDRAYFRSDVLEQRRPLMQQWCDFLTGTY